ncbi:MAG: hypothetical protein AAFV86_16120 [Pseudomonadota bacterium]
MLDARDVQRPRFGPEATRGSGVPLLDTPRAVRLMEDDLLALPPS